MPFYFVLKGFEFKAFSMHFWNVVTERKKCNFADQRLKGVNLCLIFVNSVNSLFIYLYSSNNFVRVNNVKASNLDTDEYGLEY